MVQRRNRNKKKAYFRPRQSRESWREKKEGVAVTMSMRLS